MNIAIAACRKLLEITLPFAHFVRIDSFHILISPRNAESLSNLLKSYFYKHLGYFLPPDSCTILDISHYHRSKALQSTADIVFIHVPLRSSVKTYSLFFVTAAPNTVPGTHWVLTRYLLQKMND